MTAGQGLFPMIDRRRQGNARHTESGETQAHHRAAYSCALNVRFEKKFINNLIRTGQLYCATATKSLEHSDCAASALVGRQALCIAIRRRTAPFEQSFGPSVAERL